MTHPGGVHPYEAYCKAFASTRDEILCWWYLGTSFIHPAGLSEIPLAHSRTLMAYRVRHTSPDRMVIQWTEACLINDVIHQKPMVGITSPVTGVVRPMPTAFMDGPVTYTVTRVGDGVELELEQAGAIVKSASIETFMRGPRLVIDHLEDKVRPFGNANDGTPFMSQLNNSLKVFADPAQLADPAIHNVACSGTYECRFNTQFVATTGVDEVGPACIRGVIIKSRVDEVVDQTTWDVLREALPEFFDGDRVSPDWDATFPEG